MKKGAVIGSGDDLPNKSVFMSVEPCIVSDKPIILIYTKREALIMCRKTWRHRRRQDLRGGDGTGGVRTYRGDSAHKAGLELVN